MFKRKDRHCVLVGMTEHSVQLATLQSPDEKPLKVGGFTELPAANEDAVARWLKENFPDHTGGYLAGYCSFYPPERLVVREMVNTRRFNEPAYLPGLIAEQAKISSSKEWQMAALHPGEGIPLTPESTHRIALLVGTPWSAVREAQHRLKKWGIRPRRLEIGTIAMLGGLSRHIGLSAYPNAVVAVEIAQTQTRIYIVGKDGIHTPPPLPHGLLSIEEAAMKELSAPDAVTARRQLEAPPEALKTHSRRLVRMLSRHLRPAVDYFEMQTGQRIGAIYCAHLPATLAWLEEAVGIAVDLEPFPIDFNAWMPAVGLQLEESAAVPGMSWLQPLSLIAQLASAPAAPAAAAAPAAPTAPAAPAAPVSPATPVPHGQEA